MKLEDLKVIVTGGAQGMGRHFALECDYFNGRTIDVDGGLSM